MRIVIIGAVAAGTSAAAKARRNDEGAEIIIFDKDKDISYSGCGLPYYIGNKVKDRSELVPRNASFFKKKYNIDIFTEHEILNLDALEKKLTVKNLKTEEIFMKDFDKLIISSGASPVIPNIPGIKNENVFYLRNVQSADRIKAFINENNPKKAIIVGSGFIGLEMTENLKNLGIDVTVVELAAQVMTPLDKDMALYIQNYLEKKEINLVLGDSVAAIEGKFPNAKVVLGSGKEIATDFVVAAVGIKPNIELAQRAGIELGTSGAIKVNKKMQTNFDYIYACGDCSESYSLITGKNIYRPLGSTANKTGRIVGDSITGGNLEFRGILGTGIFKVFDLTVAYTGLTEKEAIKDGYAVVVCHNIKPDKVTYYGGEEMTIKAVADKKTGKLLGAQIIGTNGVDKRIDVFATALTFGAKVEDLFHLDLAYSPPFSTTKDPVMYTGMILDNAINKGRELITPEELKTRIEKGEKIKVIDTRVSSQYEEGHVATAENIPQDKIRKELEGLDKEQVTVTYCNKGVTGNAVQNILINNEFKKVYTLSGGFKNYKVQTK
ncbi:NAD(FAD)-dependent dehydrogenase [Candidatus Desulfosporosinus infrequens]|uniref:NAD(FAD)-dependent dehydrogenase n=1 Tax=Candidatus Desulfosporosinus infrequens TaxID=2043169 RepID=A0A2U3LBR2_9FIRM|nr:NAD(FAD)-dependent dehydrogenase [Candidatus Desulfosporosinus infrequens]